MYNRYVPESSGVYRKLPVEEPKKDQPCLQAAPAEPLPDACETPCSRGEQPPCSGGPFPMDLGDLLLLCVVLLLLVDCEEDDWMNVLITAAAFLLLR